MRKKRKKSGLKDVSAMAFLNRAREYYDAAQELFAVSERRSKIGEHRALTNPVNFLFFHSAELAFKAFLRSHNLQILGERENHNLTEHYEECRKLGLVIGPGDQF